MIDLVTVVFKQELVLLQTQARSIDLYFPEQFINQILVTVNDSIDVIELIDINWWGRHKHKVKIFHKNDFSTASNFLTGWASQQLFKLLTANTSCSVYSCALDAKTWFTKPVYIDYLFDQNDRINVSLMPLFSGFNYTENFLSNFFKQSYKNIIGPGGVPFYFHTDTLRYLIEFIEKDGQKFDDFFCNNISNLTEFTLYSAFVMFQNKFSTLYSGRQSYDVVNIAHFEVDCFDELLIRMQQPTVLTVSIHRNLYNNITEHQLTKWCKLLVDKKLFSSIEIAKNQLNSLRTGVDNSHEFRL